MRSSTKNKDFDHHTELSSNVIDLIGKVLLDTNSLSQLPKVIDMLLECLSTLDKGSSEFQTLSHLHEENAASLQEELQVSTDELLHFHFPKINNNFNMASENIRSALECTHFQSNHLQ